MDGAAVGTGTQTVQIRRKSDHTVTVVCGYSTGAAHVDRNISTAGLLDLFGGVLILVPFIGVVAPGFWDLSPRTVVVVVPDLSQFPGADIEVPPGKPGSWQSVSEGATEPSPIAFQILAAPWSAGQSYVWPQEHGRFLGIAKNPRNGHVR